MVKFIYLVGWLVGWMFVHSVCQLTEGDFNFGSLFQPRREEGDEEKCNIRNEEIKQSEKLSWIFNYKTYPKTIKTDTQNKKKTETSVAVAIQQLSMAETKN